MSIQFNRQDAQSLWKNNGKTPQNALSKALSDHKLSKQEYQALKKEFTVTHPEGDFDRWMADALDGNLDQKVNQNLLKSIQSLSDQGKAVSAVSFAFNEQQTGYDAPVALHLDNPEWLAAAAKADSNDNGRIEAGELAGLYDNLSPDLMNKLRQEGAILTYDTKDKSLVFYPAPESPTLHGRYKDLKLELDVSLKDSNGVMDLARNDISGEASGSLHFDWTGPLVSGIKQAVKDKTGDWVDLDTRYVSAQHEYGPGFVIQAKSGFLATRPIVIKTDQQGQLFLDSPGFGEWARLKMGEYGLEEYALPQLKEMGLDIKMERKDGRIYLYPQKLELNDLPLSAQGEGKGQLNLDLKHKTRFSVSSDGLRAHFDHVKANGSSDVTAAQAQADKNAQGELAPDSIRGKVSAGLNYNLAKNELDTQVVLNGTEAKMDLDPEELKKLNYLPNELKNLSGEELQAKIRLQGSYRTVNGQTHQGNIQGQLELHNQGGKESTDAFARFNMQGNETSDSLTASLSAVDIHRNKPDQKVEIRAVSGQATTGKGKKPALDLQGVQGQAQLSGDHLGQARKILSGSQPGAAQFQSTLKALGVSDQDLDLLSHGSASDLKDLLSSKVFFQKLEQALIQVKADSVHIEQGTQGVKISGKSIKIEGQAGNAPQSKDAVHVGFSGSVETASSEISGQNMDLVLDSVKSNLTMQRDTEHGSLSSKMQLESDQLHTEINQGEVSIQSDRGQAKGSVKATTNQGENIDIQADFKGVSGGVTPQGLDIASAQAQGNITYKSKEGSELEMDLKAQNFKLLQQADNSWKLNVPDLKIQGQMNLKISELQKIMSKLKGKPVQMPENNKSAETVQMALETAGLTKEQAKQAVTLLWKPEIQPLLEDSNFIEALKEGESIQIQIESTGNLEMSENAEEGLTAKSARTLKANAQLSNGDGQVLIDSQIEGEGNLSYTKGELEAQAPELSVKAQGYRLDQSQIGSFEARIQEMNASIGKEVNVSTETMDSEISLYTQLDAKKLEGIQNILIDFRDDLLERVQALGLNREQFEQILQAFGRQQLETLFKSMKPEALGEVSENLGLSPEQIKQTMDLFNDEPFKKVVNNLFEYGKMLEDAKTELTLTSSLESSQWNIHDQSLLVELNKIQSQLSIHTENKAGTGHLEAAITEDSLSYERGGDQKHKVSWQPIEITAHSELKTHDGKEQLSGSAQIEGQGGEISGQGNTISSKIAPVHINAELTQKKQGQSESNIKGQVDLGNIITERELGKKNSAHLQIDDFKAQGQGSIYDQELKQTITGKGHVNLDDINVQPKALNIQGLDAEAEAQTTRQISNDRLGRAEARMQLKSDQFTSTPADGVTMSKADFEGHAQTELIEKGELQTKMRVEAKDGTLRNLQANKGNVTLEQMQSKIRMETDTPLVRGHLDGTMQVDGYSSRDNKTQADGFRVDQLSGKAYIDTERFKNILAQSPEAYAILETISKNWENNKNKKELPNPFLNDEIMVEIDKGTWQGKATKGNALKDAQNLSASFQLNNLETRLGTGNVEVRLENLSLEEGKRPEVQVSGTAKLQPRQPEFNQSVRSLVENSLKAAGVNLKTEVEFKNGEFRVKLDKWYVDGLISVDFEGSDIDVSVDKAKLLGFISARGLAARFTESKLNNYMMDIDRDENHLRLSLNEFSERLLHRDNLQIKSVETRPDNSIHLDFAYTDTKTYNAHYNQRQQDKLDHVLFHSPTNGQVRNNSQIEDIVEELEPGRLSLIFQQGSPQQLRKILEAVGNDYDNIVRAALSHKPDPKVYPIQNRAIMAATLANNSGFFESVGRDEKKHIQALNNSITPAERARFNQVLTPEELKNIQRQMH